MLVTGAPLWVTETNTWIVAPDTGGPAVVVDAPPDADGVAAVLAENDLYPVALVLTHGHIDHMGGAGDVARRFSVSAFIHPDDDYLYADPMQQLRMLFGSEVPGDFEGPERWESLDDGMVLDFADVSFDVLHTPGHTPGHCCFHVADEGVLFSGDQLFAGSIGRTDLPGGSYPALMASMRDKIVPLAPETDIFTGHGPTTTLAAELATNPFLEGFRT